jgi:hypothetical protein
MISSTARRSGLLEAMVDVEEVEAVIKQCVERLGALRVFRVGGGKP